MTQRLFHRGFTIVELLIVVVVIGVLATVGVLSYAGITQRATDNAVLSDVETLKTLQTEYSLKNQAGGRIWYSGNGIDPELEFTPSQGNVVDIVSDGVDFCIRVYNPGAATYPTLTLSATAESTVSSCTTLGPSDDALADS